MAHIGFLCPPIPGHLNPVGTLARALAKRGHRTSAFQVSEARKAIEAQQLEFHPLGEGQADTRDIAEAVARLGTLTGLTAARFTVDCGVSLARAICRYGPGAIQSAGVELLVVDQNEPAGATVAQHLKLPFINVVSLPLNREPKMPPPFVSWEYDGRIVTTVLNVAAYAVFDRLISPINRVINQYRRTWGLPGIRRPDDTFSNLAQLCQLVEDFDFPRERKPAALHYLGPFCDGGRPAVSFPYERLNRQRLVYASLGTVLTRRDRIFRVIADAFAGLDVQLVISAGGREMDATKLAGRPLVVTFAPQLELLERASLCITHGGLNTVMESLSCGVPMVAIPVTNDQPAVSARIRRSGVGEVIALHRLTSRRLRAAAERVLSIPDYHNRAGQLKMSIERAGGVERAADLIEGLLSSRADAVSPDRHRGPSKASGAYTDHVEAHAGTDFGIVGEAPPE